MDIQKTKSKMAEVNSSLSAITLNANVLNSPFKRERFKQQIRTPDPTLCYPEETHFNPKTQID